MAADTARKNEENEYGASHNTDIVTTPSREREQYVYVFPLSGRTADWY